MTQVDIEVLEKLQEETIRYYEEKFRVHELVKLYPYKSTLKTRINKAWQHFEGKLPWEMFEEISTYFLAPELAEESEPENIVENIYFYIHVTLEDYGIEVKKIRNGIQVSSKHATKEVREIVMTLILEENLLDCGDKEEIELKIFTTLSSYGYDTLLIGKGN